MSRIRPPILIALVVAALAIFGAFAVTGETADTIVDNVGVIVGDTQTVHAGDVTTPTGPYLYPGWNLIAGPNVSIATFASWYPTVTTVQTYISGYGWCTWYKSVPIPTQCVTWLYPTNAYWVYLP